MDILCEVSEKSNISPVICNKMQVENNIYVHIYTQTGWIFYVKSYQNIITIDH